MLLTSVLQTILTRSVKPFIFTNQFSESLEFETESNLGLYVHIPFCRTICSFCPYCKVTYDQTLSIKYKEALLKEISLVCVSMKEKKQVTSLYFGGGTPALMIGDLDNIIKTLKEYFIIMDGIGIELHPDDVCEGNLKKLKNAGVTMVSLGFHGRYILTEKGAYYYHYIEQIYTTAYIDKMWNVSRLTAFPEKIILQ